MKDLQVRQLESVSCCMQRFRQIFLCLESASGVGYQLQESRYLSLSESQDICFAQSEVRKACTMHLTKIPGLCGSEDDLFWRGGARQSPSLLAASLHPLLLPPQFLSLRD